MSEFKMKGFSMLFGTDKHKEATEAKRKASVKNQVANRPQPTYEGTDEFRKEKDIAKSEFEDRGVKPPPGKALVGKQKNIDVNNNGRIDGDDFKKLKKNAPGKAGCASTPAKKYKKGAPGKFIAKVAGMVIGANKQRQAAKDAAEQAKQKGIEAAMSRKLS